MIALKELFKEVYSNEVIRGSFLSETNYGIIDKLHSIIIKNLFVIDLDLDFFIFNNYAPRWNEFYFDVSHDRWRY